MVIGHYLQVAQAGDSFSILRNFGENAIRECVCNKRYKTESGYLREEEFSSVKAAVHLA